MRRMILVLAVLALALWSVPAGAITNGEHDGDRHPNVGALIALYQGDYWRVCSGSLVNEDLFLTATHCIVSPFMPPEITIDDLFVTFDEDLAVQEDGSVQPENLIAATWSAVHPAFWCSGAKCYNDVAVLGLAPGVTQSVFPGIYPVELPKVGFLDEQAAHGALGGHVFVNVGYGVQSQSKSGINPTRIEYFDGYRSMSESVFMALTRAYLKLLTNTAATGLGGSAWGDSGGPHFFSNDPTDPDYNLVVGVTNAQDPSLKALSENIRLDIPIVHDWLESLLPPDTAT